MRDALGQPVYHLFGKWPECLAIRDKSRPPCEAIFFQLSNRTWIFSQLDNHALKEAIVSKHLCNPRAQVLSLRHGPQDGPYELRVCDVVKNVVLIVHPCHDPQTHLLLPANLEWTVTLASGLIFRLLEHHVLDEQVHQTKVAHALLSLVKKTTKQLLSIRRLTLVVNGTCLALHSAISYIQPTSGEQTIYTLHFMQVYNTLTKQKEKFVPLHTGKVGMYMCGPTVYNYIHVGNIRAYAFADTLRRTLEDSGYEVRLIQNITDVGHLTADDIAQGDSGEDKVAKKAKQEHKTPTEIAEFYEEYALRTQKIMNIEPAHYYPRATAHVKQMIALIEELITKGHAYEKNGNVFLDVTTFPDYGKLSGNTLANLEVGARLEEHPDKKNPWDFALWLKAPVGHLMHWTSPWSEGYPGWHIECSAMSMEYLGDTFDIHTGGEDNIFPHHEAEIVQSEGVTGKPFVKYWLHTRHMMVDGAKMSKSKGNFYVLEDLIGKGYSPMDFRMLLVSAHYRSQMNFTWESLEQARKNKETLFAVVDRLATLSKEENNPEGFDGAESLHTVRAAMQDDLNTPQALAATLELVKKMNTLLDSGEKVNTTVLGLVFEKIFFFFGLVGDNQVIPEEIESLAKARDIARDQRDFAESDRLRDEIASKGYKVEDTARGYRLKKS